MWSARPKCSLTWTAAGEKGGQLRHDDSLGLHMQSGDFFFFSRGLLLSKVRLLGVDPLSQAHAI